MVTNSHGKHRHSRMGKIIAIYFYLHNHGSACQCGIFPLDADAFAAFVETGDILNPEVAQRYLHLLEQGGTRDAQELYLEFRGKPADPKHLLEKKGF